MGFQAPASERSLGLALPLHISLGRDPKGHEVGLWLDSPYQLGVFLGGRLDRCCRLE